MEISVLQKKDSENNLQVLLIEAIATDLHTVHRLLTTEKKEPYKVTRASTLNKTLDLLQKNSYDVILIDLGILEKNGLNTCQSIKKFAPSAPLLVIADYSDEKLAEAVIAEGAQDFIVRGEKSPDKLLLFAIHHAIAREQMLNELRNLSMKDELTNIYNRRGFLAFGLEHLKLAKRTGRTHALIYIDVDNLKSINDEHGHEMGDRVIVETAEILRKTFRTSDICARIGGDEFAVIAIESPESSELLLRGRLQKTIDEFNASKQLPFNISLSSGIANSQTTHSTSVEELLRKADESLYEQKRLKN